MPTLVAFPVLILLAILQTSVISRITLLQGSADLVLLALVAWALQEEVKSAWIWAIIGGVLMTLLSGLPFPVLLVAYLLVVAGVRLMSSRIWQVPLLAMFIGTIFGTFVVLGISYLSRVFTGASLSLVQSLSVVALPSVLINLLFSIPMYTLMTDLARWVHPIEKERE